MPLSVNINSREFDKFELTDNDLTAVRTVLAGAVPSNWDQIDLSYTGNNLTGVVYYLNSTVIRTLTLSYTGNNLTQVVVS